jgi:rubredoxin
MRKDIDPYITYVCKICRKWLYTADHGDAYTHLFQDHPKQFEELKTIAEDSNG